MPLTDTQCRGAKARLKKYKLFDFEGLYLEVLPSGRKYWWLKYRLHGKEKRLSFGLYPAVSLQEARKTKEKVRQQLKEGLDPLLVRKESRQLAVLESNQTFKAIAMEWYGKQLESWDPRYSKTVLYRLEKYVFPDLGDFPIRGLKPLVILACIQKIEVTANEMARRMKRHVSHICRYAIVTGRLEHDPTTGLEAALKKYRKSRFASIDTDELPELLYTLHHHRARLFRQTYLAIRFMLLTFVRTSELLEALWEEIDFERSLWVIPAERMKMENPHLVPLSRQALEILRELKELSGSSRYIFPSLTKPGKTMSNGTILVALKRMGYHKRMTGHGFRSLALGILKERLDFPHEVADRQLAHVPKNSTDRAYDRAKFLPQRTAMMQEYADYIDETLRNVLVAPARSCAPVLAYNTQTHVLSGNWAKCCAHPTVGFQWLEA